MISSREEGDRIVITIADNGIGFRELSGDPDRKKHLGIRNAASRLSFLCGGTLTVESTPGKGTVSRIEIPKERKKKK